MAEEVEGHRGLSSLLHILSLESDKAMFLCIAQVPSQWACRSVTEGKLSTQGCSASKVAVMGQITLALNLRL